MTVMPAPDLPAPIGNTHAPVAAMRAIKHELAMSSQPYAAADGALDATSFTNLLGIESLLRDQYSFINADASFFLPAEAAAERMATDLAADEHNGAAAAGHGHGAAPGTTAALPGWWAMPEGSTADDGQILRTDSPPSGDEVYM